MPNNQPPPTPSQATSSASTTPPRRAAGSAQPTLGELIARISENISALVRGEIDLAKVAKLKAREKVQELRSQAVSKAQDTARQVKNRLVSLAGGGTDPEGGVDTYDPSTRTLGQRVSRLFDDARDGDPASLGIVTVTGLALAGLSVTATVAAVKAFRARAGRA